MGGEIATVPEKSLGDVLPGSAWCLFGTGRFGTDVTPAALGVGVIGCVEGAGA